MRKILEAPLLVFLSACCGGVMWIPALYAFIIGEHHSARAFFYGGILALICASMVFIATLQRPKSQALRGYRKLMIFLSGYFLLPLVMAVPLLQAMPKVGLFGHWFEMVAAFTTTGGTNYPTEVPFSVHLWRGIVGWMGGLYLLTGVIAVLFPIHLGGAELLHERPKIQNQRDDNTRFLRVMKDLLPVYGGLTFALWLVLCIFDVPILNALILALSTLSTSGVMPTAYLQVGIGAEMAIFAFLLFALDHRIFLRREIEWKQLSLRQKPEYLAALVLLLATVVALILRHWSGFVNNIGPQLSTAQSFWAAFSALWGAMFTALSFLTTTGFVSAEWDTVQHWSGLSHSGIILMGLAMIGGGVATTAGGIKLLRVYLLLRYGEREVQRMIHPSSVGGGRLDMHGRAYLAWLFFMLFALSIGVVTMVFTLLGLDFEAALILTLSALSNAGPVADVAARLPIEILELSTVVKTVLAVTMIVGRLEVFVIVALLVPERWTQR